MNNSDPDPIPQDNEEMSQQIIPSNRFNWGAVSLCVGLVSLVFFAWIPFFGLIPCVLGIVFAFKDGKERSERGSGMAIAGIILGYVSFVICFFWSGIIWLWTRFAEDGMWAYYSFIF